MSRPSLRTKLLDHVVEDVIQKYPYQLPGRRELMLLHIAWGNYGFMASTHYLRKIVEAAHKTEGPILECGSGLTTLIMGLLTKDRKVPIFALEHHDGWRSRVLGVIKRYQLDHVTLISAPLKNFGEYDWYHFNKSQLPDEFKLVVCDGPPGNIKGSRYGLVPEMKNKLSNCCTILLDDANRKNEKNVMEHWRIRHGFRYRMIGSLQQFAMVNRVVDS